MKKIVEKAVVARLKYEAQYGSDLQNVSKKFLETFDEKDLYKLSFIFSSTVGTSRAHTRRAVQTNFFYLTSQNSYKSSLRAILTDIANILHLSKEDRELTKKYIVKDYYCDYVSKFMQSKIKLDYKKHIANKPSEDKLDYKERIKYRYKSKIEFKKIFNFKYGRYPDGIYPNKMKNINRFTRKYLNDLVTVAYSKHRKVWSMIDHHHNILCDINDSGLSMHSFDASKYVNMFDKTYEEKMAHVIYDIAKIAEVDMEELHKLIHDHQQT